MKTGKKGRYRCLRGFLRAYVSHLRLDAPCTGPQVLCGVLYVPFIADVKNPGRKGNEAVAVPFFLAGLPNAGKAITTGVFSVFSVILGWYAREPIRFFSCL